MTVPTVSPKWLIPWSQTMNQKQKLVKSREMAFEPDLEAKAYTQTRII